jgi:outer membrane protein
MKLRLNTTIKLLAMATTMAVAASASAQSAGEWTVKVGLNKITPKVDSGDLSAPALPGTKVAVGSDSEPILVGAYGITDNFSVEIPLGLPYKHDLFGDGAIKGTGKLGSSQVLPVTVLGQYRFFEPSAQVRPYVGLGLTYAYFHKETGSGQLTAVINTGGSPASFKLDNKLAVTMQGGVAVAITQHWFADLSVTKTLLKTKAHYSTGQTQDVKLNPLGVSLGIGFRF